MMRLTVRSLFLLSVIVIPLSSMLAQDPRDTLVSRAFNEFDTPRRVELLMSVLNPSAGPPQGPWGVGVQLLAQTLIEEGNDSLAGLWLRWAVRMSPDLQVDTVQFVPAVATAFAGARDFVKRTQGPGDSLTATSWLWPPQGTGDSLGRLQLSAPSITGPLQASVERVGPVEAGAATTVPAGSYGIRVAAAGHDSVRVTREVVPGVTTVLEFRPRPLVARVAPQAKQEVPPENVGVEPKSGKKFPWLIVLAGAAGVGAVAALAAGGGDGGGVEPPTTGGITFTFPGP